MRKTRARKAGTRTTGARKTGVRKTGRKATTAAKTPRRQSTRRRAAADDEGGAPARRPRKTASRSSTLSADEFFDDERLYECQRAIGYHFRDVSLLHLALTHSSVRDDDRPSYERLEFLGDSVVGLIVSEHLYKLLPDCDEGELTKVKSEVVSTTGLAAAAMQHGLDQYLAVGRGIQLKDGLPRSLIADVFEGVVGAVYLDRGYEAVRLYVLDQLRPFIAEALSERGDRNFKSVLQQVAQKDHGDTPRYEVVRRSGPDHARTYEVVAIVAGRRFPFAAGETKKDAEQAAAKRALQEILREKARKKPRKRAAKKTGSRTPARRRRRSTKQAS